MSPAKLFPEERKQRIVEKLKSRPKILVSDLSEEFGVSQFTVRADLDELEREGKLRRCHGGALSIEKSGQVLNYGKRLARKSREKQSIGALAATLVDDGDCIAVDTGTTTIELVRSLNPKLAITILTNDFAIADLAEEILPNARVLFLGGVMRRGYRYTSGSEVLWGMERYRTDKAFISANGFTVEDGFTSEDPEQAQIKRAYVKQARYTYALIDATKFGAVSFVKFADVSEVSGIVTDVMPDAETVASIRVRNDSLEILVH